MVPGNLPEEGEMDGMECGKKDCRKALDRGGVGNGQRDEPGGDWREKKGRGGGGGGQGLA